MLEWVANSFSGGGGGGTGLPNLGTEPKSPALQADSLPSEPPGKPHLRQSLLYFLSLLKASANNHLLKPETRGDLKKNYSFSTSRYIYSPKLVNSTFYPHCCSSRLVLTFLTLTLGY